MRTVSIVPEGIVTPMLPVPDDELDEDVVEEVLGRELQVPLPLLVLLGIWPLIVMLDAGVKAHFGTRPMTV